MSRKSVPRNLKIGSKGKQAFSLILPPRNLLFSFSEFSSVKVVTDAFTSTISPITPDLSNENK